MKKLDAPKIQIGLRLTPEEYKALKAYAQANRWSLSQTARFLIVDTSRLIEKVEKTENK